jgi:hypothetical protein
VFSMKSAVATTKGTMGMAIAQALRGGLRGWRATTRRGEENWPVAYPAKRAGRQ